LPLPVDAIASDAARQPSTAAMGSDGAMAGSSPPFVPGLSKFNSYAVSPRAGGGIGAMPAVSRANSQFGSEDSVPTLLSQPSFAPQLSHMTSLHAPVPAANYMSVDESDGSSGVVPVVNILPPTPPVLSTANSMAPAGPAQLQQQRSIVAAPMLIHQLSGSGANLMGSLQRTLSPIAATNYLSLGAEDVHVAAVPIVPTTQRAASAIVASQQPQQQLQPSQSSSGAATPIAQPALAKALSQPTVSSDVAPAVGGAASAAAPSLPSSAASASTAATSAAVASFPSSPAGVPAAATPAAAAPAPSPAPAPAAAAAVPRPRVPFDLSIEMLSCFKDVNRVQALALLDAPTAAKHAAGDYFAADAAAAAAASAPNAGAGGDEGSYLFRYCNDPDERLADGCVNRDLFVLSYLHQRKMYNTKIFRHFLGPNNSLGASTMQGFVLSDEKNPTRKDQTHTSLITLTHAIIGTYSCSNETSSILER